MLGARHFSAAYRSPESTKPAAGRSDSAGGAARAQGTSLVGPDGLLSKLTKLVFESALEAEMSEHLGAEGARLLRWTRLARPR
jgi:hypothetical protein